MLWITTAEILIMYTEKGYSILSLVTFSLQIYTCLDVKMKCRNLNNV